jgi:hypothetical protein
MSEAVRRILAWLAREREPIEVLPDPESNKRIQHGSLLRVLRDYAPTAGIFLSDRDYILCKLADIEIFLKQDKTDKHMFRREYYDCDDFAYRLMGQFSIPSWASLAFGFLWTDKHAMNCFVNEQRKLKIIEPQTDMIFEGLKPQHGSRIKAVVM